MPLRCATPPRHAHDVCCQVPPEQRDTLYAVYARQPRPTPIFYRSAISPLITL
jgi:hypothetical protein